MITIDVQGSSMGLLGADRRENLSPCELAVMRVFLDHPFSAMTGEVIARKTGEYGRAYAANSMAPAIISLRSKLGRLKKHDRFLVTLRGRGYEWRHDPPADRTHDFSMSEKGPLAGLPVPVPVEVRRTVDPKNPFAGLPEPDPVTVRRGLSALSTPTDAIVRPFSPRPAAWMPEPSIMNKKRRRRSGNASGWPLSGRARRRWRRKGWTPANHRRPAPALRLAEPGSYLELAQRYG